MKTLDKVLIALGIFVGLFIIANLVIFCIYQSVPDTLIMCTLGSGGIEVIMTTIIQTRKKKDEAEG